jgi:NhaP-type Na+/H+ or K+/H+ antiporter
LSRATVLFMGWFGPRGLASIVLALVYLVRETGLAGNSTIRLAVMATVLLSIFAHGLTAHPALHTGVFRPPPDHPAHRAAREAAAAGWRWPVSEPVVYPYW